MSAPIACPHRDGWWFICNFEARYDSKMPANMEEIRGIGLRALEAIKDKTYIYDICTCCGVTVHRP